MSQYCLPTRHNIGYMSQYFIHMKVVDSRSAFIVVTIYWPGTSDKTVQDPVVRRGVMSAFMMLVCWVSKVLQIYPLFKFFLSHNKLHHWIHWHIVKEITTNIWCRNIACQEDTTLCTCHSVESLRNTLGRFSASHLNHWSSGTLAHVLASSASPEITQIFKQIVNYYYSSYPLNQDGQVHSTLEVAQWDLQLRNNLHTDRYILSHHLKLHSIEEQKHAHMSCLFVCLLLLSFMSEFGLN